MLLKWTFLVPFLSVVGQNTDKEVPVSVKAERIDSVVEVNAAPFLGDIEDQFLGQRFVMASVRSHHEVTDREQFIIIVALVALTLILAAVGFGVGFGTR